MPDGGRLTGSVLALVQAALLPALLWPKGGSDESAFIPADWGAGVALVLLYAAVMLGVLALWARHWRLVPLAPEAAEADPSWMRGPYRFVRHPMRLAVLAGALGWCLVYRAPANFAILAVLVATALFDACRADAVLAARGGPVVRAWLQRVRAFAPGLY